MQRKTKQRQLYLLYFLLLYYLLSLRTLLLRYRDSEKAERERVGRWNTRANPKSSMDEHQDNIQ